MSTTPDVQKTSTPIAGDEKNKKRGDWRKKLHIDINADFGEELLSFASNYSSVQEAAANISRSLNDLKNWGLPQTILQYYISKGIDQLFDWQVYQKKFN